MGFLSGLLGNKKTKHYEGGSQGVSIRVMKGVTYRTGKHKGSPVEDISYVKTKGLLYVTNKRIVFVSDGQGFEKNYSINSVCSIFQCYKTSVWKYHYDIDGSKREYR